MRLCLVLLLAGPSAVLRAADAPRSFSASLTPEQKQRLGLSALTPAQLAEIDAAVSAYARGETTLAVREARQEVERESTRKIQEAERSAAETAVTEYKKKQEPGVVARALEVFKRRQGEENLVRSAARVAGEFRGWAGGTYFPLENGQVWRQVGTEINEVPPVAHAEVEIYQSGNGYWRLKYQGAWITVKRLQ